LFEFGDKYRGNYDASVGVVKSYYASVSGYMDELLWAATWLYKATDNKMYLEYVLSNANTFGGTGWSISEFSWDVKYAGLQLMLSKVNFFSLSTNPFYFIFSHVTSTFLGIQLYLDFAFVTSKIKMVEYAAIKVY